MPCKHKVCNSMVDFFFFFSIIISCFISMSDWPNVNTYCLNIWLGGLKKRKKKHFVFKVDRRVKIQDHEEIIFSTLNKLEYTWPQKIKGMHLVIHLLLIFIHLFIPLIVFQNVFHFFQIHGWLPWAKASAIYTNYKANMPVKGFASNRKIEDAFQTCGRFALWKAS